MTAALLKNNPSLKSVLSQPRKTPATIVGASHNTRQTKEMRSARPKFGRVCGGDSCSSLITDWFESAEWPEVVSNLLFQNRPPTNPTTPAPSTIEGNGSLKK